MASGGRAETTETCSVTTETQSYEARLKTFENTWTGAQTKTALAKAGFVYTGSGDKVVCPSCGLKLLNWTSTDDPLHEHAKRRQLCSFIISTYQQQRQNKPPKHPQYQELQARLDSFVGWPGRYVPKTPEELSAAGFFYIGSADRVTCFQCGITLRDWEEEHDPVVEHRRYSELCQFINNTDLNQLGVSTRNICPRTKPEENEKKIKTVGSFTKSDSRTTPTVHTDSDKSKKAQEQMASCSQEPITDCESGSSKVSSQLLEENRRLRDKRRCKICKKNPAEMLFMPCGHLVTCVDCAPEVTDCVLCGKTILATVRTYFS